MKRRGAHGLYRKRALVEAYPGLERLEAEYFEGHFEGSAVGPYPDDAFDILLMESVLEHVESPERALVAALRCLKAGGVLFVGTTNRYRLTNG
jgi:2-polyprenyl-3-methyl-5-hydroxy-6-metoxy-1,4-benzoquinol methylase